MKDWRRATSCNGMAQPRIEEGISISIHHLTFGETNVSSAMHVPIAAIAVSGSGPVIRHFGEISLNSQDMPAARPTHNLRIFRQLRLFEILTIILSRMKFTRICSESKEKAGHLLSSLVSVSSLSTNSVIHQAHGRNHKSNNSCHAHTCAHFTLIGNESFIRLSCHWPRVIPAEFVIKSAFFLLEPEVVTALRKPE